MLSDTIPESSEELFLEESFFSANLTALFELEDNVEPVTAANDADYENLYGWPGAA